MKRCCFPFAVLLYRKDPEISVENSLDLTLAKDITDIIAQLKGALEELTEATTEDLDAKLGELELILKDLEMLSEGDENQDNIVVAENMSKDLKNIFKEALELLNNLSESKADGLSLKNNDIKAEAVKFNDLLSAKPTNTELLTTMKAATDKLIKTNEELALQDSELVLDEEVVKELNVESIEGEFNNFDGDFLMQQQSPEEQAVKAMLNNDVDSAFELKIENIVSQKSQPSLQSTNLVSNPSKIIDQVVKHLEMLQNNSKVSIVLNPESLGKVNIQLLSTKEGLSAQFTAATIEARDLLMKGLEGLKETLISHGVQVDNVSVKLAESQKSTYEQDWTEQEGSRGGNKGQEHSNREEKEKGLFEKMLAQTSENENGNV